MIEIESLTELDEAIKSGKEFDSCIFAAGDWEPITIMELMLMEFGDIISLINHARLRVKS